jgi:GNAT superfamily N-acetyltransferase
MTHRIAPATTPEDIAAAAGLVRVYAASLPVDLGYQDFEAEVAGLPGAYAPPRGALILARNEAGAPIGCGAIRPLSPEIAEMKRLYVVPSARGTGLGRALAEALIAESARLGYGTLRLDTLPSMAGALALYRTLGFREIPAYYQTPVAGTVFLERALSTQGHGVDPY